MTCVSIVTNNFTAFPFLKEVLFVYRGAISQLDKNEAMFIFIIETASLFILNGDFDEYLNNIKTIRDSGCTGTSGKNMLQCFLYL